MPNRSPIAYSISAETQTAPAPINPDWIISGQPKARSATLSQSADKQAVTVLWECTAGIFRWKFDSDETVFIIDGAVTVNWDGGRITLKVGDSCYFPAGSVTTWTVHHAVRKIAFIRVPPPVPVSLGLRAFWAVRRIVAGIGARPAVASDNKAVAAD